jgi:hypothetical protein
MRGVGGDEMIRRSPLCLGLALVAACLPGCGADSKKAGAESPGADAGGPAPFVMEGGPFTLAPGDEKYLCYTGTVKEATAFHSFSIGAYKSVHHMFFAQTLAPEEEGVHECPVLFKPTWLPVFTSGRGATRLDLPEGSAFRLDKGTQLVMQVHLLNTGSETLTEKVEVHANPMDPGEQKYQAALVPFGTTVFDLPPNQPSTVSHDCVMQSDFDAFVMFPHMHLMGKTMSFQVGKDAASLTDVYRGAYDFNNQQLIPQTFSLHKGDFTRMTCEFDNPTSKHVRYGESTNDEMCFFSLFVKDGQSLDGTCVDVTAIFNGPGIPGTDGGPPAN